MLETERKAKQMLCQVFMGQSFADEPDRVGLIAAPTLESAVQALRGWCELDCDWGVYEPTIPPMVVYEKDLAIVTYQSSFGQVIGADEYIIVPQELDHVFFFAEDWRETFI